MSGGDLVCVEADWLVESGRLAVAYNYPARDELTAVIVTLWRRS